MKVARTVVSTRYYPADADFVVGLERNAALLERIDAALARPVRSLALGRTSYGPGALIRLPDEEPCGPGPSLPAVTYLRAQVDPSSRTSLVSCRRAVHTYL